ncbi:MULTISPECIES: hypothetical protein [unclassified Streptomyces]|uniref:hypothetical protein n=1 Tax=unclassified Streptomyces TaxID=2593676 RepID=UPI0003666E25|nr:MULTISPECIES: hypothetical protein [unclassified Streptomyces]MYT29264.1 hypothetical protein [Streptomyces sp. SID8354]
MPSATAAPLDAVRSVRTHPADGGALLRAEQRVDADQLYLRAHFPGEAVYPGVFLLDTLQQAAAGTVPDARIARVISLRCLAPLAGGAEFVLEATTRPMGGGCTEVTGSYLRADGVCAARIRAELGPPLPEADPVRPPRTAGTAGPEPARLRELLPHGWPMLLVDQVIHLEPGKRLTALKAVTAAEPCYRNVPRAAAAEEYDYPFSLLLESFGQSAAVLWRTAAREQEDTGIPMFVAARDARQYFPVRPGDVVTHEVVLEHVSTGSALAHGTSHVSGRAVAGWRSLMAVSRPPRQVLPAAAARPGQSQEERS